MMMHIVLTPLLLLRILMTIEVCGNTDDSYRQNHIYIYVIMSNVNFEFLKCHENAWYVSLDNLNRL